MKIVVIQTDRFQGSYHHVTVTAQTELGSVTLKDESSNDRDADYGDERIETNSTEYADVEAFCNAGYDTGKDISAILPISERQDKEEALIAERKAALSAGKKSFISKVDGSYWLYRPRKRTWQQVSSETYFLNDGEI